MHKISLIVLFVALAQLALSLPIIDGEAIVRSRRDVEPIEGSGIEGSGVEDGSGDEEKKDESTQTIEQAPLTGNSDAVVQESVKEPVAEDAPLTGEAEEKKDEVEAKKGEFVN